MSEELTPMNHRELWLQAIATGTVPEWLAPMTHEELWLKAIAQGGGSGGGVLVVTDTNGTLDKTWQEIYDADFAVVVQSVQAGKKKYAVTAVLRNRDNTEFLVNLIEDPASYTASSADGYPTKA